MGTPYMGPASRRGQRRLVTSFGKVLLWGLGAAGGGGGLPAMGFLLPMPSAGKTRGHGAPQGEGMHAGCSALCFSKEDPSTFIVGLESGQLYKCSTVAKEACPGSGRDATLTLP